jgi:hypothetical protein
VLHSDRMLDLEEQTDVRLLDGGESSQQLDDGIMSDSELCSQVPLDVLADVAVDKLKAATIPTTN